MTHEERRRGARAYRDRVGGSLVEPFVYTDGDGEGRMIIGVGVELGGTLHFAVEGRALPGSPAYRLGWWVTSWHRRRLARR